MAMRGGRPFGPPPGRNQPDYRHPERYYGHPPPDTDDSYSSVDSDPLEDSSESSSHHSDESMPELGLHDIGDPGPEGSHHAGWVSTDSSDSAPRTHRDDTSYEGPSRSGYRGQLSSRSRSPSVTSEQRYVEPPRQVPIYRDWPSSQGFGPSGPRPGPGRPSRDEDNEIGPSTRRVSREAPREIRSETEDSLRRVIRDVVGLLRRQQPSPRHERDAPPSPPDFLKMVMMMKNLGTRRFFGDSDPLEADAWLQHIERNFAATRCPEDFKTDVAVHYLMKDASNWWDGVKSHYVWSEIPWAVFRQEFRRKYFPAEARDRLEAQFQELVQGGRSVREYEAEFTRLRRFAHYGLGDEAAVVRKFLRGLRPELMSRLVVNEYHGLFELVERAVNVEEGLEVERAFLERENRDRVQFQRRQQQQQPPRNHVSRHGGTGQGSGGSANRGQVRGRGQFQTFGRGRGRGMGGRGTPAIDSLPECYRCGRRGHFARACPNTGHSYPVPANVTCFTCNQPGHYATSCPVTHPQIAQQPAVRTIEAPPENDHAPKRQAVMGRVYPLDKPEPSRPSKGPVSGT